MKLFDAKRLGKTVLRSLIFAYAFLFLLALFGKNILLFPAPKSSYQNDLLTQQIDGEDGKVSYRFYEVKDPKYTVLYSHGNGEDIGELDYQMKALSQNFKVDIYTYDYPGYGSSEGKPTVSSVTQSAEAMLRHLQSKGLKSEEIILWGRSVGGGPTMHLAQQGKFAVVILESAFVEACQVITKKRILPFTYFDNLSAVERADEPMFFSHGKQDAIIPFSHGKMLYSKAEVKKAFYWNDEAGHNDLSFRGSGAYYQAVKDFVGEL